MGGDSAGTIVTTAMELLLLKLAVYEDQEEERVIIISQNKRKKWIVLLVYSIGLIPVVALRAIVEPKVVPLSVLARYNTTQVPLVLSHHATTTFSSSAAISGSSDAPVVLLMFMISLKLTPLSGLALKNTSQLSVLLLFSNHTAKIFSPDLTSTGFAERPDVLLRLNVSSKVAPPSALLAKNISEFVVVVFSGHTTKTFSPSRVITGL
jgi:hypothetical protein